MGKDTPGSPLSDAVRFPHGAIAWDLNYRGELDFLRQARQQPASLDVRIEDGWDYFIHGWAAVMEQVFDREITPAQLAAMAEAAAPFRPSHVASDRIAGSRV
jgi:shikimate 5-dehydrogenase